MNTKNILLEAVSLCLSMGVAGCSTEDDPIERPVENTKSLVILYENDVHCGIDGYTKMAGLRDAINRSDTAYATIVSCGDYLQGAVAGAISRGQYIIDIMRNINYTAITSAQLDQ